MYNTGKFVAKTGDTWLGDGGRHTFFCRDFFSIPLEDLPKVDFIYTDPPWNDSILRKFYQYAGAENPPTFAQFIDDFAQRLSLCCPEGRVFIDMGLPGLPLLREAMSQWGAVLLGEVFLSYGKGLSYVANLFTFSEQTVPVDLSRFHGVGLVQYKNLVREFAQKDARFLDPCAGEGLFLTEAIKVGMRGLSTEIIPDKFCSQLRRLSALGIQLEQVPHEQH